MKTNTALALFAAVLLLSTVGYGAQVDAAEITLAGPEQLVFSHRRDACRPDDIPDAPAHAFRDSAGRVHLFAPHFVNFSFVGPELNSVTHDCTVAFRGGENDDPAAFDDREWLTSFWTEDGSRVYALAHNEFQGNLRPWLCPTRRYDDCWYNAIIAAVSIDGGFHFSREEGGIVAAPAYRYDPAPGHPVGYFSPSNIVKHGGFYYTMIFAEPIGAQQRGVCLLRTDDLGRADSWRAWDGTGFNTRLANPYLRPAGEPAQRVCAPIDPDHLKSHVLSLVIHRPTGRYLALMAVEAGAHPRFVVSESADLFTWSEPKPIMETGPPAAGQCGNHPQRVLPSLLDPDSPSRNFETVGDTAYLYFTQFHLDGCADTLDRDLIRVPVSIRPNG